MSAEPSASIWEVTRMILENPGTSPTVIAHAHGFSAAEVAELLPIFLDNLRTDFSSADAPALVPPAPQPGESPEEHADRYLRELARNEQLDVVGYDTLGGDLDELDDADLDSDPGAALDLARDPTFLHAPDEPTPHEPADREEQVDDAEPGDPAPDLPDLAEDDPFAGPADALDLADPGLDDLPDDAAGADDSGEPFAVS